MKTKALLKFIVAVFAVAICSPQLTQAQTMGGDDVKVTEHNTGTRTNTRMIVADNGWIYLMAHGGAETDNSNVKAFRSKDDGATYQILKDWYPTDNYQYQDFDIEVTGKNESDIKVWSVEILNKPDENKSRIAVFRLDANLQNPVRVFYEEFFNKNLYNVSLASNYRAPSPTGVGGNPFALAFAYTGYDRGSGRSFVNYVYSVDGGANFVQKQIYSQEGEHKIGQVDLSLGSTSLELLDNWPIMGVVFEMDKCTILPMDPAPRRNIGFLSNYVDYDSDFAWDAPIKLNKSLWTSNPKIQMMLDDADNTINGVNSFNFMIAFDSYYRQDEDSDWDVNFVFPEPSFHYGVGYTPSFDDLVRVVITPYVWHQKEPGIGYDKKTGHYLFTYREQKDDGVYDLKYKWFNYDKICDQSLWSDTFTYTSSANALYTPQVDINPTKGLVCWSWAEYLPGKQIVWSDTQWTHANGVEDIVMQEGSMKLYPNPAQEYAVISLPTAANCKAVVYDMQGRVVAEASFSGNEYRLNVQHLAKGTYMLKVVSDTERFVEKLIVE